MSLSIISSSFSILFVLITIINGEDVVTNLTISSTTPPPASSPSSQSTICSYPCDCAGDKPRIIDCSDKQLDAIPNASEWPKNVAIEARFEHNNFVHLRSFGSVPGLTRLSLSHCRVTVIDENIFENMTNITFIDLSNNELTSSALKPNIFKGQYSPEAYQPLKAMRGLHLGYNAIHTLDQDLFEHLPYLTELSLKNNPIEVLDHTTIIAISSLDYLKILDLSYTGLKTIPAGSLHSPKYIVELHLQGNHFKSVPTLALADTHDLKVLSLDDNPIEVIDNNSFPLLRSLEHLSLSYLVNLTRVDSASFSGMRSLQELVLSDNPRLDFIHPDAFKGQYSEGDDWTLLRLHLNGNKLGVLPQDLIKKWNALDELSLYENPWVCDCANQWIVTDLLPVLDKMNSKPLVCYEPIKLRGKTIQELAAKDEHLRCLDEIDDNQMDRDGAILIGMLIGILLAIPLTIAVIAIWKKFIAPRIFTRHQIPGEYSRAFYKRANTSNFNNET